MGISRWQMVVGGKGGHLYNPSTKEHGRRRTFATAFVILVAATTSLPGQTHSVPQPSTDGMEPAVAERLISAWQALTATLDPDSGLTDRQRAERVGEACEVFHSHGSLDPAIACYRKAIELDSQSARWPYLLGYILKNQGRTADSLELLRQSESLQPSPFTRFRVAEVLALEGRIDEASEILSALDGSPGLEASVDAELGKIALLTGDPETAIDRLSSALARQPEAVSLHFPLAQAYRTSGDLESAQRHADLAGQRSVRAADPILQQVGERSVSSETYVAMGARALKTGDLELARTAYQTAVELNPDNQRAWMNLGAVALQQEELDAAEMHLRRALELDPGYGFAHFNLAETLNRAHRDEEALEHYRLAAEANPANVEFGIALGDQLLRAGRLEESAVQYQRVAGAAPDYARPRYLRALALVALGDLDQAADSASAALALDPENEEIARAFVRLASTAPSDGHRGQGLDIARGLFQKHRSTDEGELLAMALAANGQFEEAAKIQQEIVTALRGAGVGARVATYLESNLERYRHGERAVSPWPG